MAIAEQSEGTLTETTQWATARSRFQALMEEDPVFAADVRAAVAGAEASGTDDAEDAETLARAHAGEFGAEAFETRYGAELARELKTRHGG